MGEQFRNPNLLASVNLLETKTMKALPGASYFIGALLAVTFSCDSALGVNPKQRIFVLTDISNVGFRRGTAPTS